MTALAVITKLQTIIEKIAKFRVDLRVLNQWTTVIEMNTKQTTLKSNDLDQFRDRFRGLGQGQFRRHVLAPGPHLLKGQEIAHLIQVHSEFNNMSAMVEDSVSLEYC